MCLFHSSCALCLFLFVGCLLFLLFLRCLIYYGGGPWWCQPWGNRCKCDSPFIWRAFTQIWRCPTWNCRSHALQVFVAFNSLSCWFPIRICFPWIRLVCSCKWCACPRIIIYWKCIVFKMCAFFGSGKFFGKAL